MVHLPKRKEIFTTRLPPEAARLIRAMAKKEGVPVSSLLENLIEEALIGRVRQSRSSPPKTNASQRDMSHVAELVLSEIRRRGGDEALEARIEEGIRTFRVNNKGGAPEKDSERKTAQRKKIRRPGACAPGVPGSCLPPSEEFSE